MALTIKERAKNLFSSDAKIPASDSMVSDQGNNQVASAISESKEKLRERKKPGFRGDSAKSTETGTKPPEQIAAELSALLQPSVWQPIVRAPADTMLALTNHPHWDIPKEETEPLAVTCSTAMQYAAIKSPGLLAVSLFLIHATIVYLPRTIKELQIRKMEKQIKDKKDNNPISKNEP